MRAPCVRERGRDETEGRHHNGVTRFEIEQQCGHFERGGTRRGEQDVPHAELIAQQLGRARRERAVGRRMTVLDGGAHAFDLPALEARAIERNAFAGVGGRDERRVRLHVHGFGSASSWSQRW
jgi:hypothetical protein